MTIYPGGDKISYRRLSRSRQNFLGYFVAATESPGLFVSLSTFDNFSKCPGASVTVYFVTGSIISIILSMLGDSVAATNILGNSVIIS